MARLPARKKKLRAIAKSFVALPPTSTRTRLRPTAAEDAQLRRIGDYLGSLLRCDLVTRARMGTVVPALNQRARRKKALTALTSSRWAGSLTRASEDQYRLGMRALVDHTRELRASIQQIDRHLASPIGTTGLNGAAGYRTKREQFQKLRRVDILENRLKAAETRVAAGAPKVVFGSLALLRKRNNLVAAGLKRKQWRAQWDAARLFLTADGESGAPRANLRWGMSPVC